MNNEEKMLEILAQMQTDMVQMQTNMVQMQTDMVQIQTDMAQMREDQIQMRKDQTQMREDIQQIKDRLDCVEEQATRTALLQENDIRRTLDALTEGQGLTHQMMRELTSKRETDELRDQVDILRTVVALHSREIEALKKAQ